jgi:hypothetical protein
LTHCFIASNRAFFKFSLGVCLLLVRIQLRLSREFIGFDFCFFNFSINLDLLRGILGGYVHSVLSIINGVLVLTYSAPDRYGVKPLRRGGQPW